MINIREVESEDAEQIENVYYKTWLKTYPNEDVGITENDIKDKFKNYFTSESINNLKEAIKIIPENSKFFVAVDDESSKIIGVCRIFIRENFNQLQAIYVLPEYQGRGVGKLFWNECLKYFDKNKSIIVQVATYNKKAIGFYEKLGFTDNGKRFTEERHRMPISKILIPEMEMVRN